MSDGNYKDLALTVDMTSPESAEATQSVGLLTVFLLVGCGVLVRYLKRG